MKKTDSFSKFFPFIVLVLSFLFSPFIYSQTLTLEDSLVAYYPFNGNANDESGNGNDGTVNGASLTTDRFGNPNSAYYFDGSDDYINVPASPVLDTLHSITTSCWINCEGFPGAVANTMLHKRANTNDPTGYAFDILESYGASRLRLLKSNNSFNVSNYEFENSYWYHVVGIYHDSVVKYYINGQIDTSYYNPSPLYPNNVELKIGCRLLGHEQFLGIIDDIRIYNCALNSAQIWQLYTMDGIMLNMPDTLMACHEECIELDAGTGYSSYLWNTGEITQTIFATETGTYIVTVEDDFNNTTTDSTYVNIINAHIAQNDTTICAGEFLELSIGSYSNPSTIEGFSFEGVLNGHAYFLSDSPTNWIQARDICTSLGGHLATITSQNENDYIVNFSPSFPYGGVSIGFTDEIQEGNFQWVTGESVNYTNWGPGEPNNYGNEDYAELNNGIWNDMVNGYLQFVLEFDNYSADSYLWSTGDTSSTISISPTLTTTYYVEITDGINWCTDSVTIYVNDPIQINLPDTLMACQQDSIILDAGAGFENYLWSTGETTQTLAVFQTGIYAVNVEDSFGCTATDSTYVNIINAHIAQNDTTICAGESIELSITCGGSANITDGLVAWYPFNGNALDESGHGHNGIITGSSSTLDRFGINNSAYYFDGSNNIKANIGSITTRTISFWYKSDYPLQSWPEFYQYNNSYCNMIGLGGPFPPDHGKPYMRVQHANNNAHFVVADTLPLFNQWHNVIVQYEESSNNIYLYVDNNLHGIGEYTSSGLYVPGYNNNVITFGAAHSLENGHFLTGFLDDIRIYNRILSEEEIETLYYEGIGNYTYLWSTGDTTASISVFPTETTTYYVNITDGINWCTDSVTVYVNDPIQINLPDTLLACQEDSLVLDAGAGFENYLWSTGETTQTLAVFQTGIYAVNVEDSFGCTATNSTYVNIINAHIEQNDTTICAGESIELSIIGGSTIITNGLVGYWPFNGNANDESGNGHDGVVNGATITTDRFGNMDNAYNFDGINNFIQIGDPSTIELGISDFTISLWVNFNILNNSSDIIVKSQPSNWVSGNKGIKVWDNYPYFGNYGLGIPGVTPQLSSEQWHHVLISHDNDLDRLEYFINGIKYTHTPPWDIINLPPDNPTDLLYIGRNGQGWYLNAILDDIRIYDRVLNSNEVQSLFYEGTGTYSYLWSNGDTTATISVSPTETTTYYCEINDGINWCTDSVTVTVEHPVELELKAFLEGPFLSTNMLRYLNLLGFMPLEQPYNVEPWNYNGNEVVSEIPFLAVDWVLVELRDTEGDVTTATSDKTIARKACFIQNDGMITDLDGNYPITIDAEFSNNIYVVIWHRNHLPVISANPLGLNGGIYQYDFTEFAGQTFGSETSCVEVGIDTWGLASGDGNNNKEIDNNDKNDVWLPNRGSVGYNIADYNLDGQVNTSDKVVSWEPNSGKGSKIPD